MSFSGNRLRENGKAVFAINREIVNTARSVDEWVGEKKEPALAPAKIPTKRLTIDVPEERHRSLKTRAAAEGVKMADIVRRLIEQAV